MRCSRPVEQADILVSELLGELSLFACLHPVGTRHVTSHHITSHHITSHHVTSCHITSCHITSCHITSHHVTSHYITSHHIMSHHITHHFFVLKYHDRAAKGSNTDHKYVGSWGDNELSPECLDGARVFLKPQGISIPSSYTSFVGTVLRLLRMY